ncbi:hypothetical protein ABZ671_00535 [Micromonospora sp. NPDC006766]|uniref:hypothetical protein n=1 Tax=Micromonospora sp. NPDC006766 TaxID=3154778 RepID=UPI0033D599BF
MTHALATVEHAITVRQPYAQCIAIGRKPVENRGKPTQHRGPIAIHAGQAEHEHGKTDPRVIALYGADPTVGMARGAVIAVANLVDCHPAEDRGPGRTCCEPWGAAVYVTKAKAVPAFHLVFADVALLASPVPARGSLWFPWVMPADVQTAVRARLAEAVTR